MFDWITRVVSESGYPGILGLMLAENIFPPIPSELIMPLAGFVAAKGELNPVLVVLAGTLGSVLGALPWYYLGLWLGRERICALAARHGRWLTLSERDVGKAIDWFEKHGGKAVLLGRLVPTGRTLVSVPAGMARMPLLPFLVYSAIGTLIWTALLTAAGYLLQSEYHVVGHYVDGASKIIIGLIVLTYLYRLVSGGRLGERVREWARWLRRDVHAIYLSARDPRVPWYAKVWAVLIAAYAASPIDLIPDFIPVLGHLDDAILIPLAVLLAVRLIPAEVLEEHRRSAEAAAEAPTDWRVGALILAIWAIALAFILRWLIAYATGG
ncbi:MAG TPA: VTT domain-containing protein [Geminicoccaceae bacterium]|nr:VTT domain-containing protein [Geminicoccaceae bacterium]